MSYPQPPAPLPTTGRGETGYPRSGCGPVAGSPSPSFWERGLGGEGLSADKLSSPAEGGMGWQEGEPANVTPPRSPRPLRAANGSARPRVGRLDTPVKQTTITLF